MAHATNRLARIYDEINRDGLEWLMDPVKNYQRYQDIYANKSPRTRFIRRFAISLLCLPLFSLAYVFTRTTGVILNPREWRDNPLKPFMMSCLAGGAIGVPMLAMGVNRLARLDWRVSLRRRQRLHGLANLGKRQGLHRLASGHLLNGRASLDRPQNSQTGKRMVGNSVG